MLVVASYDEKELFALIANGDETAFKQLYVQLKPMLAGFIFKLTKSQDAVLEILQESLFRLWINRRKLPEVQHPRAWLFRLAANECHHYLRKRVLQQRLKGNLERQATAHDYTYSTEIELSFRETNHLIQQAVAALAPRQREIYQLSRDKGLKIREIAVYLDLSEKYVKKTLMHSLHRIRQWLIEAGKYVPLLLVWIIR